MELEILREKLNKCLNTIEPIIRKNINLQILNNILIETEKNFLKISATNLETSLVWRILAKIKKEGKFCLPASLLKSLIGLIKEEKIKISTENNNLVIEINNQKNQIQGINPDDFPIIPKVESEDFFEIETSKLSEGIGQVINIPSVSQVKPEISGVYFSLKKDKLYLVATDSFRLVEKNIGLTQKNKDFSFILPQTAARELFNVLGVKGGRVKVYFTTNQVLFEWLAEENPYPEVWFSSRLIDGEFPNYQEIIPKKYTCQIILNREEFQSQIKKAGLFSGKASEIKISILPKEKQVKIFSQSPDVGKNESFLPMRIEEKTEKNVEISFNYRFLLDGLSNIKSSEIIFGLSSEDGPATIKPVSGEDYIYILMPIKSV